MQKRRIYRPSCPERSVHSGQHGSRPSSRGKTRPFIFMPLNSTWNRTTESFKGRGRLDGAESVNACKGLLSPFPLKLQILGELCKTTPPPPEVRRSVILFASGAKRCLDKFDWGVCVCVCGGLRWPIGQLIFQEQKMPPLRYKSPYFFPSPSFLHYIGKFLPLPT